MTSVFVALRAILLAFRQEESSFKSLLRVLLILPTEFCLFKIHVSSAEWNREENLIALCRSLIRQKPGALELILEAPRVQHFVDRISN